MKRAAAVIICAALANFNILPILVLKPLSVAETSFGGREYLWLVFPSLAIGLLTKE